MNDEKQEVVLDEFETPYSETAAIEHRGKSKSYIFSELLESDFDQAMDESDKKISFSDRLVVASVTDIDGTRFTIERLKKMPRAIAAKIQMKALLVNGYSEEAEKAAGES